MSVTIEAPFKQFTDADGKPLENGYIYIGVAGYNPEQNPITVYWDSALTIPASQPIRTIGGYPARSGTAAKLYSETIYSITVRNKNSELMFTSLSSDVMSVPEQPDSIFKNYIAGPTFERGTTSGWILGRDTGTTVPVSGGIGGGISSFLPLTIDDVTPLSGEGSLVLTKPASPIQGSTMISSDITIDREDVNSTLQLSFSYQTPSGGVYTGGDLGVFVWDINGAALVPCSASAIAGSNGSPGKHITTFSTTANRVYRVIFMWTSAVNANGFSIELDSIVMTPSAAGLTTKLELLTSGKTYGALDANYAVVMDNAGAETVDIKAGAVSAGTAITFVQRGAGATSLTIASGVSMALLPGVTSLVWDGVAWRTAPVWMTDTITAGKTYGTLEYDTRIIANLAGASALDIVAGAKSAGTHLEIINTSNYTLTLTTASGVTLAWTRGTVALVWDGSAWQLVSTGGAGFRQVFSAGTAQTWKAPVTGSYDVTVVGGGGGGGGAKSTYDGNAQAAGGSGGAGGLAQKLYRLQSGQSCTYTVGAAGVAGNASSSIDAGSGGTSSFTDGSAAISATGGVGGGTAGNGAAGLLAGAGGNGGVGSGGDVNAGGAMGLKGSYFGAGSGDFAVVDGVGDLAGAIIAGGPPAPSPLGGGYRSAKNLLISSPNEVAGVSGTGAGASGGGSVATTTGATNHLIDGPVGVAGVVIIEW